MAQDVEGSRDVLCKMIEDVHRGDQDEEDECKPCVICLDKIEEICIAIPCKHSNFDLQCLLIWLGQRPACPLCKCDILLDIGTFLIIIHRSDSCDRSEI